MIRKIYKIKFLMIGIAFLAFLSSCDEFLTVDPQGEVTTETFYNNRSEAFSGLMGAYNRIGSGFVGNEGFFRDVQMFRIISDDQGYDPASAAVNGGVSGGVIGYYNGTKLTPSDGVIAGVYDQLMLSINPINSVIDNVPNAQMDETEKEMFIAEARFLRAYQWFKAVRLFGGVPLFTEEISTIENLERPRNTAEEVYMQIVEDLTWAEDRLADAGEVETLRATKWAAKALLAKVYMYMSSEPLNLDYWQQAADKAREVINNSPHEMLADYQAVHSDQNEGNNEVIFDIEYSNAYGTVWQGEGSWVKGHFRWRWNPPSVDLKNAFDPADIRDDVYLADSFLLEDGTWWHIRNRKNRWQNFKQIQNDAILRDAAATGKNFIVLRMAEMHLILAEALNEANSGPNAEAYTAINIVRRRGFAQDMNAVSPYDVTPGLSQAQFRDTVWLERRLELYNENNRSLDLKRQGRLLDVMQALDPETNLEAHHVLFPIPFTAIVNNPLLEQNPGYATE